MRKILWLDDLRNPQDFLKLNNDDKVFWVKSYNEFVNWITKNGLPDQVFFDHDLGEESENGYECAKWLLNYCIENNLTKEIPTYGMQSANPVGRKNIESLFNSFKKIFNLK